MRTRGCRVKYCRAPPFTPDTENTPVRATAVGRDAVLAGDPKGIRLLCNATLITDIPSRGSKEERIRIHLQVWADIRNNGYKR